ncbi:MAG TPA: hypothetical protein VM222_08195 [Planctomycetota bacterium]|nr:hypothetical protein [Planctomycetota bacterium]
MVQIAKLLRKKLSELLVDEGLVKDDQIQEVLRRQRATGEGLVEILVSMGFLTELDVARTLVKQSGLPFIDASRYRINKDGIAAVPADLMWQNQIIILDKIGKTLLVAISNVISTEILEKLEKVSGSQIFVYVSTAGQIQMALDKNVTKSDAKPAPAKPGAPGAAVKPGVQPPGPAPAGATAVRPAPPAPGSPPAVRPVNPPSGAMPAVRPVNPPSGSMPAVAPARPGTQIRK